MPPDPTIWALEAHTRGKHLVLQQYMNAWLPIMTRWNGRVLFIDAFAGPGEYSKGEHGSPIIALKALTEHSAKSRITAEILYLFIEERKDRSQHLGQVLARECPNIPPNCRYQIIPSTFDDTVNKALDSLEGQHASLPPAFVMIDPFGVSDTPMRTIERILANPRSEVYVSVMYDFINRFKEHENFESHLDDLFGTSNWRQGIDIHDTTLRKNFFFDLYKSQLKAAGATQVLHFELYEHNRLIYAIFFGTQDTEGCDKMKQAIWNVAPFGNYRFFGGRMAQLSLSGGLVDFNAFIDELTQEFEGRGWVTIEEVITFAKSDKTNFHSGHLKVTTLKPMEERGLIEVQEGTRKRTGTFPDGTILKFVCPPTTNVSALQPSLF